MSTSGRTVPAGMGGAGTGGAPPPQAAPPQAAPAEAAAPAAAAPVMERSGTPVHVSASAAMPVGSWVRVLAWVIDSDSERATLGLYSEGLLVAVFQAQVVHQITYSTTPPLTEAGIGVAPTVPLRGGGRGPLGAAAPLQGQGSAARFGGGPAELASDTGNSETRRVFPVVPMWL